ncbi:class I adenylate-forming enzyme family protein [Haladaptatus sp. NG-SE-30]
MSLSLARYADLWDDRPAVVDEGETLSYAGLARRVEATAGRLTALGVETNDSVVVVSRNRVEVLVLLFAVWRIGGVFAPVSHRLTPATISRPVNRIDPDLVVFESAQRDLVRQFDSTHSFEEFEHVTPADHEPVERARTDTCLLVHTDGGEQVVRLSIRAIEWNCIAAVSGWGLGRSDATVTLLPLALSDSLLRFVLPLVTVGGRVVLQRAFDPESALAAIERHGVTCVAAGPTEFRELADVAGTNAKSFESLESLDSLDWVATHARVPPDVREAFPVPFIRAYGRPETGPNVLRGTPDDERTGRPLPHCDVRIEMETSEMDDIGELAVRGPHTASGYLGGEEFDEWVPTGDLFCRNSGGYVFVGRVDEPFESEGERVHPETVETVLESHPDVRAAGVIETVAETGGTAPKAVVVGDVSPGKLREFAEERLAAHEVPRVVEVAGSLPRRATGELDRGTLRKRFGGG